MTDLLWPLQLSFRRRPRLLVRAIARRRLRVFCFTSIDFVHLFQQRSCETGLELERFCVLHRLLTFIAEANAMSDECSGFAEVSIVFLHDVLDDAERGGNPKHAEVLLD